MCDQSGTTPAVVVRRRSTPEGDDTHRVVVGGPAIRQVTDGAIVVALPIAARSCFSQSSRQPCFRSSVWCWACSRKRSAIQAEVGFRPKRITASRIAPATVTAAYLPPTSMKVEVPSTKSMAEHYDRPLTVTGLLIVLSEARLSGPM
ncbi:MAG: hypothetical protein WBA45_09680 [Microthrixaceae bacterium]